MLKKIMEELVKLKKNEILTLNLGFKIFIGNGGVIFLLKSDGGQNALNSGNG